MSGADYGEIRMRDGRALAYAEYGNAIGQPVIHCHGTPSSRVEGNLTFSGNVAAEMGVVTQMGNQGSAEDGLREAVEVIRSGAITMRKNELISRLIPNIIGDIGCT